MARGKASVGIFDLDGRIHLGIGAGVVRVEAVPIAEMIHLVECVRLAGRPSA
jgi:hypothetical protein